ncbi:MAG: AMP-binding protein [Acidimicrobiales bacterium]|jgi:acyl-CoA synthetase (AMP-forming)/AMP-acid ligase II
MTNWNFADAWEVAAEVRGDVRALAHDKDDRSWAEFDRRAAGVARTLLGAGLGHQAKVVQYLYNSNEYLESVFAAEKVSMIPVNTNYRYADDELVHVWDNADAEAVMFHGSFTEIVDRVRSRVPNVKLWIHADDGSERCPEWAMPYDDAANALEPGEDTHVRGQVPRSGDDLYFLYTGGTTGMPKGVMWRQDDLFALLNSGSPMPMPEDRGLDGVRETIAALSSAPPVVLPACPLMHGTGAFTAFSCLMLGGCVVTLPGRGFDAEVLLDTVQAEKVNLVTIVGDAFAKPILRALDAHPGRWDLSSLLGVVSSGVMWSEDCKRGLHRHNPNMLLFDSFGSSEAIGMGSSVSTAGAEAHTASFKIGERAKVIDDEGNDVVPGSGKPGRIALGGRIPVGYYKDVEKTASTFVTIGGERYSVPGDYAIVEADGSLRLLGRGSVSINTGGEKVYPEEVEEVLKTQPAVADAAVVGVPDERFGEAITAVVELAPGGEATDGELVDHVKAHIAHFKAPRHVVFVDSVGRSPAGKVDYKMLRALAMDRLGVIA